jgi:zinc protease
MASLVDRTPFAGSTHVVERWRLDNGLTVLLVEDHAAPVFSWQTWFDVGSANETVGKTGIAHLFEHLMFKATKNVADGEFDKIMEARGGSTNAATWVDWTFYLSGLPAKGDNLELVAKLEADRMVNLVLNDAQVEAEREVVLNERRFRVDNSPDGLASEALYALAFDVHPYRWPTIGWEADIRAITTRDCLDFYRVWYAPNNATVVIVGDVDSAKTIGIVERSYGAIASQPVPEERLAAEPPQKAEKRKELALTIESEKLLVAWHVPGMTAAERPALQVMEQLAFGGNSARARRRLVDEQQIAVDVGSMLTPFKHPGLLEVKVEMREGKRGEEGLAALDSVLDRFAAEDVTALELTKARNQVELGFRHGLKTATERAEALGNMHLTAGDFRRLFDEVPRVRAVTAADVRAAAAALLAPANRAVLFARRSKTPSTLGPPWGGPT